MTLDIPNIFAITMGGIAVLISGKVAYNQWKAALAARLFQKGASEAIKQMMTKAKTGEEFSISNDRTGEEIFLKIVNKKKNKEKKKDA